MVSSAWIPCLGLVIDVTSARTRILRTYVLNDLAYEVLYQAAEIADGISLTALKNIIKHIFKLTHKVSSTTRSSGHSFCSHTPEQLREVIYVLHYSGGHRSPTVIQVRTASSKSPTVLVSFRLATVNFFSPPITTFSHNFTDLRDVRGRVAAEQKLLAIKNISRQNCHFSSLTYIPVYTWCTSFNKYTIFCHLFDGPILATIIHRTATTVVTLRMPHKAHYPS